MPDSIVIGRLTFVDFGPHFNFYDVTVVRNTPQGASLKRMLLTPEGGDCTVPATVETSSAALTYSVAQLLANKNLCDIPEKELRRELKRKKKFHGFSGAVVKIQVQCGGVQRIVNTEILDRDMFDANPQTPEHTSWTMGVLERIDKQLAPGPMEKPVFATGEEANSHLSIDEEMAARIRAREFDNLFQGAAAKPSQILIQAQKTIPNPSVKLGSADPVKPFKPDLPPYPPLAKAARIEGEVNMRVIIGREGNVAGIDVESGNAMLAPSAKEAVNTWTFDPVFAGWQTRVTIVFQRNCPAE